MIEFASTQAAFDGSGASLVPQRYPHAPLTAAAVETNAVKRLSFPDDPDHPYVADSNKLVVLSATEAVLVHEDSGNGVLNLWLCEDTGNGYKIASPSEGSVVGSATDADTSVTVDIAALDGDRITAGNFLTVDGTGEDLYVSEVTSAVDQGGGVWRFALTVVRGIRTGSDAAPIPDASTVSVPKHIRVAHTGDPDFTTSFDAKFFRPDKLLITARHVTDVADRWTAQFATRNGDGFSLSGVAVGDTPEQALDLKIAYTGYQDADGDNWIIYYDSVGVDEDAPAIRINEAGITAVLAGEAPADVDAARYHMIPRGVLNRREGYPPCVTGGVWRFGPDPSYGNDFMYIKDVGAGETDSQVAARLTKVYSTLAIVHMGGGVFSHLAQYESTGDIRQEYITAFDAESSVFGPESSALPLSTDPTESGFYGGVAPGFAFGTWSADYHGKLGAVSDSISFVDGPGVGDEVITTLTIRD